MPTSGMPGREDSEKDLTSSSNRDLASVLQKGGIASPSTISRLIKMGSSLKREHLFQSDDLDEQTPQQLTLKEKLLFWAIDAPGIVLFTIWCLVYISFTFACWWYAPFSTPSIKGMEPMPNVHVIMHQAKFVKVLATCIFGICIIIDIAGVLFQVSSKKRQLNSLVLFINLVSFTVYLSTIYDLYPSMYDFQGNPIYVQFFAQWMNTTPVMILVLASLGSSMQDSLVQDWGIVIRAILWDEVMLTLGLTHTFLGPGLYGWICFGCAGCCFMTVMWYIHSISSISLSNAATTYEIMSLRGLEAITYMLWVLFPSLHILHHLGLLDTLQYEIARTVVDVVVKAIYSVALMSGNFCLLDTVATLRVAQLRSERDSKQTAVVRAEVMNRALQMACVEAETSARLSRRFVANISHELRTPLNSVIAFNSLLLDAEELDPLHREYVKSSLTSAEALLGIINQVLEYAKLEAREDSDTGKGKGDGAPAIELNKQPFLLTDICEDLCDILSARVNMRKVDFAVDVAKQKKFEMLPALVGDSFRLRQCLINLCDNAIKFARDDHGKVILRIHVDSQEKDLAQLRIEVWDNGEGIPEEKQKLLFKPFSQVSSHLRNHNGTGLGLVITKRIVNAMGGNVECRSSVGGGGTTFTVTVPLPIAKSEDVKREEATQDGLSGRVLVVLREGPGLEFVRGLCEEWGLQSSVISFEENPHGHARAIATSQRLLEALKAQDEAVLVMDCQVYLHLIADSPSSLASRRLLLVGHLDDQSKLPPKSMAQFVLRPIKPSLFRSKLEAAFSLTPAPVETSVVKPQKPQTEAEEAAPTGEDRMQILIVEDHPVNQKVAIAMLHKALGKDKVNIVLANNGQEGLDLATARGHAFDLILMDVRMPVMDGLDATRKIREWEEQRTDPPYFIVAMTAHASQADVEECLSSGMDRYASKPLNLNVMRDLMAEFLTWRSANPRVSPTA